MFLQVSAAALRTRGRGNADSRLMSHVSHTCDPPSTGSIS